MIYWLLNKPNIGHIHTVGIRTNINWILCHDHGLEHVDELVVTSFGHKSSAIV